MVIIEKLVAWMDNAPAPMRARAADALVRAWQVSDLEADERDAAEAAMTCILDDPEEGVRLSLSRALADAIDPPRHLVIALACDTPEVSVPILSSSPLLLDGELVRIVETGNTDQQVAIAGRAWLSGAVCHALADKAALEACLTLLTNPAAHIGEEAFFRLATRFSDEGVLRRCMLTRPDIGMRARTLLIEAYAQSLVSGEEVQDPRRQREVSESSEKAIITYAAQVSDGENRDLVHALIARSRLTTAFLLRAICMGNLTLFCHALSVLSGQPADRVEHVLKDMRAHAFRAIYEKSGMPAQAEPVFAAALKAWCRHLSCNAGEDSDKLPYLVTREVLAGYEGKRDIVVDELLLLLRRICTDSARQSARSTVGRLALQHEQSAALPAPEAQEKEADNAQAEELLSPDELFRFAEHLADELAELALRDEYELGETRERLEPANQQEMPEDAIVVGTTRSHHSRVASSILNMSSAGIAAGAASNDGEAPQVAAA